MGRVTVQVSRGEDSRPLVLLKDAEQLVLDGGRHVFAAVPSSDGVGGQILVDKHPFARVIRSCSFGSSERARSRRARH